MARASRSGPSDNRLRPGWRAAVADHVVGLAWSPDGRFLAAAAVSGPVTIFDAATGKVAHQLAGHGFGTAAVAWQPGGTLLATAGQDKTVRLWDTTTGAEAHALAGGAAWVERLAWHPAGAHLASGAGKNARVWDANGTLLHAYTPQAGTVMDLAWVPNTSHLTVLAYGAARVYRLDSDEPVQSFEWKGSPLAMAWSPDGSVLVHGNQDATVHFWYAATGADLQMSGYPTKVRELSWDFTSRYLATGGGPVGCVWDCKAGPKGPEGSQPQALEGHDDNLTAIAFQGRGYLLASAAADGRVLLWQPGNKKAPQVGQFRFDGGAGASAVAWSPDDKSVAAGASDGSVGMLRAV